MSGNPDRINEVSKRLSVRTRPFLGVSRESLPSTLPQFSLSESGFRIQLNYRPLAWDPLPQDITDVYQALLEDYSAPPSPGDIQWVLFGIARDRHFNDFRALRDIQFHMTEQLFAEKRYLPALSDYYEIACKDINGPCHPLNPPPGQECPSGWQYDPAQGFFDRAVLERILDIQTRRLMNAKEMRDYFFEEHLRRLEFSKPLPLSPEHTWERLYEALQHLQHLGEQTMLC